MRALLLSVIAVPLAFATLPALAQSNPSADDIIQSLKPGGNLMQGTRGIKAINPNATPATAATSGSSGTSAAPAKMPAKAADAGPSVSLTVEFATDSTELTPQARQTL